MERGEKCPKGGRAVPRGTLQSPMALSLLLLPWSRLLGGSPSPFPKDACWGSGIQRLPGGLLGSC